LRRIAIGFSQKSWRSTTLIGPIRERRMPKQIGSPAPGALLVVLAVTILAAGPVHAAADCVAAPGSQAPQGSHWYYRTDHATGRKCWYVSPEGRKGHGQVSQNPTGRAQPTEDSLPTSGTVGDRWTQPPQIEQSPTPTWPVTAAGNMQAVAPSPPSPEGTALERAVSGPAEQERTGTDAQAAKLDTPAQQPAARTAKMAALIAITPVSMLILVVGLLALAGIFLRPFFQTTPMRRPSPRQFKDDLAVVIAAARRAASPLPPPYLPRDYAGGRRCSDEEPNSSRAKPRHVIENVEEALLGVLRDWERPTASAN
jgi:hypothetical protein